MMYTIFIVTSFFVILVFVLIPLYVIKLYKTMEDLHVLLVKISILGDILEEFSNEYERKPIEEELFDKYIKLKNEFNY